jgi:DNA invertase Pin-like site-specific DNA recombinase
MTYGYLRVSNEKSTIENQRFEINNFCKKNNLKVDEWIEETISGAKEVDKRKLGKLLDKLQKDDLLICTEISRLGRSLMMVMAILNDCLRRGIRVWTIKDNYRLGDDISSMVIAFAFSLAAQIERQLISQLAKMFNVHRHTIIRFNRKIKSNNQKEKREQIEKLIKNKKKIIKLFKEGRSLNEIAYRLSVTNNILNNFCRKELKIEIR